MKNLYKQLLGYLPVAFALSTFVINCYYGHSFGIPSFKIYAYRQYLRTLSEHFDVGNVLLKISSFQVIHFFKQYLLGLGYINNASIFISLLLSLSSLFGIHFRENGKNYYSEWLILQIFYKHYYSLDPLREH